MINESEGRAPPRTPTLCEVCRRAQVRAGEDGCARLLTGDDEDFAADYTAECYANGYEREKADKLRLRAQLKDAAKTIRNGATALCEVARLVETRQTREALLIIAHGLA